MTSERPVEQRDFGWALRAMKNGHRVRRTGWRPPRDWWVWIETPTEGGPFGWPVFGKNWTDGTVAWAPTHADLLAEDWELHS